MILQALYEYYERKNAANSGFLAPDGWIDRPIDFIIDINSNGQALAPTCLQSMQGSKRKPGPTRRLPNIGKQSLKHNNSGKDANLLWDNSGFALGFGDKGIPKLTAFIATIQQWLPQSDDQAVYALLRFLCRIRDEPNFRALLANSWPDYELLASGQPTVAFRYTNDDADLICQRASVRHAFQRCFETQGNGPRGICLITGEAGTTIDLSHSVIKNVWHAQPAGASIVSFNERAFESYGKTKRQGENAPVSRSASAAYTKALNALLGDGSRQRAQVGDASMVFWSQKISVVEDVFACVFGDWDDPDARTEQIRAIFDAPYAGKFADQISDEKFYILGLAPNEGRIAVRFWKETSASEVAKRIHSWFSDLQLVRGPNDPEYPSMHNLLKAIAVQAKTENIPPKLGGDLMRSILDGSPFPATWLNAAVQRSRSEQRVTYLRAAAIRACLNRRIRFSASESTEKEFQPMLDPSNTNTGYRLGRLFAILERIQESASPGLNATIRDRYYGAASSTPVAVFTTLLRLKNAHLKKLSTGQTIWFERQLADVMGGISDFPKHMPLPDQARFALGYYHQRQDFFTKKTDEPTTNTEGN